MVPSPTGEGRAVRRRERPPALDYPVALQLAGRPVLLVGAGVIATGRLRQLLEVRAQVRVVAPLASEEVRRAAEAGLIRLEERGYRPGDCRGAFVVFTAADAPGVNRAVVEEARALGVLANAADAPELCDFTVPSIGRRGPVTVAVSTSGQAPALARALRQRAMEAIGPEYGVLARLLGRLRRHAPGGRERARRLQALVDSGAAQLIAARDRAGLRRLLREIWQLHPLPPAGEGRGEGAHEREGTEASP